MAGAATGVAAVGGGVCVAEVSAELLAGCGAVCISVLLKAFLRLPLLALQILDTLDSSPTKVHHPKRILPLAGMQDAGQDDSVAHAPWQEQCGIHAAS